jgi:peptidyl-prolyl cis-trans isomerase A (cyclophilin A)
VHHTEPAPTCIEPAPNPHRTRTEPASNPHREGSTVADNAISATIETNYGDIDVLLFPHHAPKTVANFADLADGTKTWTDPRTGEKTNRRFYDGLTFHRVIAGFMIQGGDPIGNGTGGPGKDLEFDDEIHPELSFTEPYVLAMANAGKRMGKGTNGSQFFITVSTPTYLQGRHTIFGRVANDSSRLVVDKIAAVETDQERPKDEVQIKSVSIQRA